MHCTIITLYEVSLISITLKSSIYVMWREEMHVINNCIYPQRMNPYSLSHKNEVKKTTLITHRIIIIIDGNLYQNCILLPHTYTCTYKTPSTLFFLHFPLFLDAKEKRNRKTLKIDVVKRYVRDSLSHYLMLFLTWYFCFYLWYAIDVILPPKCNISCTLVGRQCESFVVFGIK